MATLQELLAEVIGDEGTQTKEASADSESKPAATEEVDQVLSDLGLEDNSENTKTASEENTSSEGGHMGLTELYEQIMGDSGVSEETEKTASDTETEETPSENESVSTDASTAFGELAGEYFNKMSSAFIEKAAASLEAEAGKGEKPLEHQQQSGSMTSVIGQKSDPAMSVNHSASDGEPVHASTGGNSPYWPLREAALKKAILKRMQAAAAGDIKD